MRYIITGVAVLLGITFLLSSFVAGQQFKEIATSPVALPMDNYPFLGFVSGDLLMDDKDVASPAEMAQRVQQRLGLIALGGLVFLLIGVAFFALTKVTKNESDSDSEDGSGEP